MCPHTPTCASASASDRASARIVAAHPEQGWNLLCNRVIVFDDGGYLLPPDPSRATPPRSAGTRVRRRLVAA
jgi:hypothetical protein